MQVMRLLETNRVPDAVIRRAIRLSLRRGLQQRYGAKERAAQRRALVEKLRQSPIAINTAAANEQHYEAPTEFFQLVLGRRLKYSCCYWPQERTTLDEAEEAMLDLTCQRAGIEDGMDVLELGCGWGSLCLWIAERYPRCQVLAMSNSRTQRAYIEGRRQAQGLDNLMVVTADVQKFATERRFDRVVSVEMFEHMKNYELLLARIAEWLRPQGLLFVHMFGHRELAWEFDADDPNDWMARTFFSGGVMPAADLLPTFQRDLRLVEQWRVNGAHYGRTLRAWLDRLDENEAAVRLVLAQTYGTDNEALWWVNWRLFFMVCEETFNLNQGDEYLVLHYLLARP